MKHNDFKSHNPNNTTLLHYLLQAFKTPFPNFNLKLLSTKEVENIIKTLKTKNSAGYNEISTKLLKISSPFISSPLIYICNKSISSGIFPDHLKYVIVKHFLRRATGPTFPTTDLYVC
jgi:phosphatidylinositol kinase/protein kinase (PI-3  family)